MNHLEHRIAIAQRFGTRIAAGDAVFLGQTEGISALPCTVSKGERRELSGVNKFMLLQVMRDKGWTDPRFFTADQIQASGWVIQPEASPVALQYLVANDEHGVALDVPEVRRFNVFNAEQISGVPEQVLQQKSRAEHIGIAASRAGFEPGLTQLRSAVGAWVESLQSDRRVDSAAGLALRVKLALSLLEVQASVPRESGADQKLTQAWAEMLQEDPLVFFECVRDAELLAAQVMGYVRSVEAEVEMKESLERAKASRPAGTTVEAARAQRLEAAFNERQAVLAVPFHEKDRVKELGAMWYPASMVWFVPKGIDLNRFKEWDPRSHSLGPVATEQVVISEFAKEMEQLGLDTDKIVADGSWHNVSVNTKRSAANKSGSYFLSLSGHQGEGPSGYIVNHHIGVSHAWTYDGPVLTPEQKASLRAAALEREAAHERERAKEHERAAVHAVEILASPDCRPAAGHGYVTKKGIPPEGLRQVPGATLLRYEEFHGESGKSAIRENEMYLLVPMCNAAGNVRAVQAISQDGSLKSFMRGGQKKGLHFVLGAPSLDALLADPRCTGIGFGEGLATGASFRSATRLPVVVCFDAGNMETVVAEAAKNIPSRILPVIAADNDQFHVEQALGFLSNHLGVNPHARSGTVVEVMSGLNGSRLVSLGDAVADGQWHQAPFGKYCMTLERERDSTEVREVRIEIVAAETQRKMTARFSNRGLEAGRKAIQELACDGEPSRAILALPSFPDLTNRPTDWNDLDKFGPSAVRAVLHEIPGLDRLIPRSIGRAPAPEPGRLGLRAGVAR